MNNWLPYNMIAGSFVYSDAAIEKMIREIHSPEIWNSLAAQDINLFASEENATFWLFAYPSLIGWPHAFDWLFSPVVGNTKYPGDLWGIDELGNLLLVETKLRTKKRSDPFEDFVQYQKENGWKTAASEEMLLKRWTKLHACERKFWGQRKTELDNQTFTDATAEGIVPYSSKRFATRNWSCLYTDVIAPRLFQDNVYIEKLKKYLKVRTQSGTEAIYYFGVVFCEDPSSALLSKKGENHLNELKELAGDDKVILGSITAQKIPEDRCVKIIYTTD